MLFEYWRSLPPGHLVHPEDRPLLDRHPGQFELRMPPGQIAGPLKTAPVVACFVNPGFDASDAELAQDPNTRRALLAQLDGEQAYPTQFPAWKSWYVERVGRVKNPVEDLARTVAILNFCAYASPNTESLSRALVQSLPSSIAAKRYLHEVLLPEAGRGQRFVVICRGAWAWGVKRSQESDNVRFAPNPAGGHFGPALSTAIQQWLSKRSAK